MEEESMEVDECDVCGGEHITQDCPDLSPDAEFVEISRARATLPYNVEAVDQTDGSVVVVAKCVIPAKTKLGPFEARRTTQEISNEAGFILKIFMKTAQPVWLDTSSEAECNWLCLVHTAQDAGQQNCMAVQLSTDIYYTTTRQVAAGEQLCVWYAPHYAKKLGFTPQPDGQTTTLLGQQVMLAAAPVYFVVGDQLMSLDQTDFTLETLVTDAKQPAPDVDAAQEEPAGEEPDAAEIPPAEIPPAEIISPEKPTVLCAPERRTRGARGSDWGNKGHPCSVCGLIFPARSVLEQHRMVHEFQLKAADIAASVSTTSLTEATLEDITEDLTGIAGDDGSQSSAEPQGTGDVFNSLTCPRETHIIHQVQGPYKCSQCAEVFEDMQNLAIHVKVHVLEADKAQKAELYAKVQMKEERNFMNTNMLDTGRSPLLTGTPLKRKRGRPRKSEQMYSAPVEKIKQEPKEKVSVNVQCALKMGSKVESGVRISSRIKQRKQTNKFVSARELLAGDGFEKSDEDDVDDEEENEESVATSVILVTETASETPPDAVVITPTSDEPPEDGEILEAPEPCQTEAAESSETEATAADLLTDTGSCDLKTPEMAITLPVVEEDLDEGEDVQPSDLQALADVEDTEMESENICEDSVPAESEQAVTVTEVEEMDEPEQEKKAFTVMSRQVHVPKKRGRKPKVYEDETFGSVSMEKTLQTAILSKTVEVNKEKNIFRCIPCISTFPTYVQLKSHMLVHQKLASCHKCNRVFTVDAFAKHPCVAGIKMEVQPSQDLENAPETFSCSFCGKVFAKQSYLNTHMHCHMKLYRCSKCDKQFARKESYIRHNCPKGNSKTVFCEMCGAKFETAEYLSRHMATHTGEFTCKFCSSSFARKESLLSHYCYKHKEKVESGEITAFACSKCHSVFSKKISLENHMVKHTGKFTCETCTRHFATSFKLEGHACSGVPDASASNKKECLKCGKSFSKEKLYQQHMRVHNEAFKCSLCSRLYSRKEELVNHVLECTAQIQAETIGEIKCSVCMEQFPDPYSFKIHFKKHTHPYQCEKCNKRFIRTINMTKHKCTPILDGAVECEHCGKRFRNEILLLRHIQIHEDPKYKCDQCGKKFHRIDYYNKHVCIDDEGKAVQMDLDMKKTDIVPEVTSHICPHCGKSFVNISNLNKHVRIHGDKTEQCEECGKYFHQKSALKQHMEFVHTEDYKVQCKVCGKRMKSRNSLYGHMTMFHNTRILIYACEECGKTFRQKGNLRKHMLCHSEKCTYHCNQCSKSFRFPEQLRKHTLWHQSGFKYKCTECSKQYVMEHELKRHIALIHTKNSYVCPYCSTVCHHFQTMRRHLQRRHFEIPHWQTNTNVFISSLTDTGGEDKSMLRSVLLQQNAVNVAGNEVDMSLMETFKTTISTPSDEQKEVDVVVMPLPKEEAVDALTQQSMPQNSVLFEGRMHITDDGVTTDHMPGLILTSVGMGGNVVVGDVLQQALAGQQVHQANNLLNAGMDITGMDANGMGMQQLPASLAGIQSSESGPVIVAEVQEMMQDGGATSAPQTVIIHTDGSQIDPNFLTPEIAEALQALSQQGSLDMDQPTMITIDADGNLMSTQTLVQQQEEEQKEQEMGAGGVGDVEAQANDFVLISAEQQQQHQEQLQNMSSIEQILRLV